MSGGIGRGDSVLWCGVQVTNPSSYVCYIGVTRRALCVSRGLWCATSLAVVPCTLLPTLLALLALLRRPVGPAPAPPARALPLTPRLRVMPKPLPDARLSVRAPRPVTPPLTARVWRGGVPDAGAAHATPLLRPRRPPPPPRGAPVVASACREPSALDGGRVPTLVRRPPTDVATALGAALPSTPSPTLPSCSRTGSNPEARWRPGLPGKATLAPAPGPDPRLPLRRASLLEPPPLLPALSSPTGDSSSWTR